VEGEVKRGLAAALCVAVAALFLTSPALALDCAAKPTETDRLLCGSEELEHADRTMWSSINALRDLATAEEFERMVADQRQWLDQWARSCDPKASLAGYVACLRPALSERSIMLGSRYHEMANGRQGDPPFDIGGLPLVLKQTPSGGCSSAIFIGDKMAGPCASRLDPRARFRNASVDAMAFVANSGGAGYICANFPVYIIAVRRDRPPEITAVPSKYGDRHDDACVDPHRTATGFIFAARPVAGLDGWSQEWTPDGGLAPPKFIPFEPQPGTTMKSGGGGLLIENEQFLRTLRRLATESGQSPASFIKAFAWASTDTKVLVDNLPANLSIFRGCATPGLPWTCTAHTEADRVVYDSAANRLYFIIAKGGVECEYTWQHRDGTNDLAGSIFLPPRKDWPDEVMTTLKRSYCSPH
jgi:hypothetical protein